MNATTIRLFETEDIRKCRLASSTLNPYTDLNVFLQSAQEILFNLPSTFLSNLLSFKKEGNQDGYLQVKGLPFDQELIDTPSSGEAARQRNVFLSEFHLSMVSLLLGELYGFYQESGTAVFGNVIPSKKNQHVQASDSSQVFLQLHTEIAFHQYKPDFLILYCLRQDHNKTAKTFVSSIRNALSFISPKACDELRKRQFSIACDYSFGNLDGKNNTIKEMAILGGSKTDPYMVYDSDLMVPQTKAAEAAMDELNTALCHSMREVVLETGDLLVIDNRRTAHARSMFDASYDGKDRWLQRVMVKQDLDSVKQIFPEDFLSIREIV